MRKGCHGTASICRGSCSRDCGGPGGWSPADLGYGSLVFKQALGSTDRGWYIMDHFGFAQKMYRVKVSRTYLWPLGAPAPSFCDEQCYLNVYQAIHGLYVAHICSNINRLEGMYTVR